MKQVQLFSKILNNQRGDAFVVAMVTVGVSLVSSLLMMNYSLQIESGSKRPKIKSMMSSIEGKVRSVLLSPTSYANCSSSETVSVRDSCQLKTNLVTDLTLVIPEAKCPAKKPSCGILVQLKAPFQNNLVISGQTYTRAQVNIAYEGTDLALKSLDVVVDVPADILQSSGVYKCPPAKPKFKGFNPNGSMNCEALSAQLGVNKYVIGVDPNGLATTAGSLPTSDLSCSSGQFFQSVQWVNGGSSISTTCANRRDPFALFGFTPKNGTGGDVTYTPVP